MRLLALSVLVLSLAARPAPAQDSEDKGWLVGLLEGALSDSGREVSIEGFAGALSSTATMTRLTIADTQGVWLVLDDARMQWDRAALLDGRIEIGALSAARVEVIRLPVMPPRQGPTPEAQGFSLPELPVAVSLDTLGIGNLTLGAAILGEEVHLAAHGRARLDGGAGDMRLTVVRIDGRDGFLRLDGAFDNASRELALALDLNEGAGGIAARTLGLPGEPALGLTVAGQGAIDRFDAGLTLSTDGRERLAGQLRTQPSPQGTALRIDLGGDLTPLLPPDLASVVGADARLVAQARLGDGTVDLRDLTLTAEALRVTGEARFGGGEGLATTARLQVQAPDLALFSDLAGLELGGAGRFDLTLAADPLAGLYDLTLDGTVTDAAIGTATLDQMLQGEARFHLAARRGTEGLVVDALTVATDTARVNATAAMSSLGLTTTFEAGLDQPEKLVAGLIGPLTATGQATRLDGGEWLVNVDAAGPGGTRAEIVGALNEDGTADFGLEGQLPLALIGLASRQIQTGGTAQFDLTLRGPLGVQALSGQMRIAGARTALPGLGQSIDDLGGRIDIAGGDADLTLAGRAVGGGDLVLEGRVALAAPFDASLALDVADLAMADPRLYSTSASGRIMLTGPLGGGARIAGDLRLGQTEIRVPTESIGAAAMPEVSHHRAPSAVTATLDRAGLNPRGGSSGAAGPDYTLDLNLSAPDRIFVRGRGLDAEMGGALRLAGSLASLRPEGQFDLIRGRLDLLDQRFTLTEGALRLEGRFLPMLHLVAKTTARTGAEITVALDGPATEPVVTLTSVPALPGDEILAQLILGRNLSEISPLQAARLAAAAATLAGRGGIGIVDRIRGRFGLDDLDLVTGENGATAVRAGKYIGENVYSDITLSADGSAEVNLNLDLDGPYTARGTLSSDGDTSIGIFYEKDY